MAHFHVKSNTNRYLPDDEVHCVASLWDAARAFVSDAKTLAVLLAEGCDRGGCNTCGWCRTYDELMARIIDTEAVRAAVRAETAMFGVSPWVFSAPVGPDLIVWVEQVDGITQSCSS